MGDIMQNNLFYRRGTQNTSKEKLSFKKRKENTLASLNEVEHFLFNYKHFMRYIKLYKFFK